MSIEHLQAKRAALQSSLEQLVGQINRVNGAVAVIDELLQEAAKAQRIANEQAVADHKAWLAKEADAYRFGASPPTAPEMLPVLPIDEDAPAYDLAPLEAYLAPESDPA